MGGMEVDGSQSVTAWGINVGSKLAQGVTKIYSNIFTAGFVAFLFFFWGGGRKWLTLVGRKPGTDVMITIFCDF
jgi:hypothetical protein